MCDNPKHVVLISVALINDADVLDARAVVVQKVKSSSEVIDEAGKKKIAELIDDEMGDVPSSGTTLVTSAVEYCQTCGCRDTTFGFSGGLTDLEKEIKDSKNDRDGGKGFPQTVGSLIAALLDVGLASERQNHLTELSALPEVLIQFEKQRGLARTKRKKKRYN